MYTRQKLNKILSPDNIVKKSPPTGFTPLFSGILYERLPRWIKPNGLSTTYIDKVGIHSPFQNGHDQEQL
jgi:hypothetical protein